MSAVAWVALVAAALSLVAGREMYRHAYAYSGLETHTTESKKSSKRMYLALFAVILAIGAEVVVAGLSAPMASPSLPLYVAAAVAFIAMVGGLVLGYTRGRQKLTPAS